MSSREGRAASHLILKTAMAELHLPSQEGVVITHGETTLSISFHAAGGFTISYDDPNVTAHGSVPTSPPVPGTVMPDGTIYAGISPDTGRAFYAAAQDAPKCMTWSEAKSYAARCYDHGHSDWRIPSLGELNILFNNRSAIGGFPERPPFPNGQHWASSEYQYHNYDAYTKNFGDGRQTNFNKMSIFAVRCVRG